MCSLPNEKHLRLPRIESICQQQISCNSEIKFVFQGRVVKNVGKKENAGYKQINKLIFSAAVCAIQYQKCMFALYDLVLC